MESIEGRALNIGFVFVVCLLLSVCFPFLDHVHNFFQMGLALEIAVVEKVAVAEGQLFSNDGDVFMVEACVLQAGTLSAEVVDVFHSGPKSKYHVAVKPGSDWSRV